MKRIITSVCKNLHKYVDGNAVVAEVGYYLSDETFVYPITPSSPASNDVDLFNTQKRKNIFGNITTVTQMHSEAAVIGSIQGALLEGNLVTSFTSSQGLLLMMPTLQQISAELLPLVLHVPSRSIATNSTNIFADHTDTMAVRSTGCAMLSSKSPQDAYDKAIIAHLASLNTSLPFIHFFDGHQVSHQINAVETIDLGEIKNLLPWEKIQEHKERKLHPTHPTRIGSSIGFYNYQLNEAVYPYYRDAYKIIEGVFEDVSKLTGRKYEPFKYYGAENPEKIIISMGATSLDINKVVERVNEIGEEKVGAISVELFRPWNAEELLKRIPDSVKHIAVLDRTREMGGNGEPLYLDVLATLFNGKRFDVSVTHGRYGLGGSQTTPNDLKAVFDNMDKKEKKDYFILGINDDVTNRNLEVVNPLPKVKGGKLECVFYGSGGDGTISAVQNSVKIFNENTKKFCQTMTTHTPHKSGSITVADLRICNKVIEDGYHILDNAANIVVCSHQSYVRKIPLVKKLKKGGSFLLNCYFEEDTMMEDIERILPSSLKKAIAEKEIDFYVVNANKIAIDCGIRGRTNTILMSIFLQILGNFENQLIESALFKIIQDSYEHKGQKTIDDNKLAVTRSFDSWYKVDYPLDEWKNLENKDTTVGLPDFIKDIQLPFCQTREKDVPLSKFNERGYTPLGTAKYEKRGIANRLPKWDSSKCIQCNTCSFNCPHSVIRNFLVDENDEVITDKIPLEGPNSKLGLDFTIQISGYDCTGCYACVGVCPAGALSGVEMSNAIRDDYQKKYDYCIENNQNERFKKPKKPNMQSMMYNPTFFEFSGACAGCAESSNIKVLTQLFGDRLIIANATGCTTVFGSYYTSSPYTVNRSGMGPAWGRSLFENAAEFGYGMKMATKTARINLENNVKEYLKQDNVDENLKGFFEEWLVHKDDSEECIERYKLIKEIFDGSYPYDVLEPGSLLHKIKMDVEHFVKPVHFIIGGDGWAIDIDSAGVDHVLASGEDVTILVLDNELYANTGGQQSKSSPLGTYAKLATGGKRTPKKRLWEQAMTYPNVYVATIATTHDPNHTLKVFREAEAFPGPSLIIAFCPCTEHVTVDENGSVLALGETRKETEKIAVESGYFPLFSHNPLLIKEGKNPLVMKTKSLKRPVSEYVYRERRFLNLFKKNIELADELLKYLQDDVNERFERLKHLEKRDFSKDDQNQKEE